jgi:hypothetical protein
MNSKEQMELTMIAKEHNIAVDDIQRRALETWHDPAFFPDALMRDHAILGLVGEAGENAELHKKDLFKPGYQTTREERLDELADDPRGTARRVGRCALLRGYFGLAGRLHD